MQGFELNFSQIKLFTENMDKLNIPYTVKITNYTTNIESAMGTYKFMKSAKSGRFFSASQKVKKDCEKHPVPITQKSDLNYFSLNYSNIGNLRQGENIVLIDLTAAYPQTLLNAGYISKETFGYLKTCEKMDRLGSIGMMASEKNIFKMQAGKVIDYTSETNKMAGFFYFCVYAVNSIMQQIAEKYPENFCFFWVDGIYIRNINTQIESEIFSLLNFWNYPAKKEVVNINSPPVFTDRETRVYYLNEKEKQKVLFFPSQKNFFKQCLINELLKNEPNKQSIGKDVGCQSSRAMSKKQH